MTLLTKVLWNLSFDSGQGITGIFFALLAVAILFLGLMLLLAIPGSVFTLAMTGGPRRLMRTIYLILIMLLL